MDLEKVLFSSFWLGLCILLGGVAFLIVGFENIFNTDIENGVLFALGVGAIFVAGGLDIMYGSVKDYVAIDWKLFKRRSLSSLFLIVGCGILAWNVVSGEIIYWFFLKIVNFICSFALMRLFEDSFLR